MLWWCSTDMNLKLHRGVLGLGISVFWAGGGGVLFSVILLWKFKKIEFSRTPPLPYPTRSMQSANISTNPLNTVDWQIIRMVLIFCSVKFKPSRLALFEKFPVFGKVWLEKIYFDNWLWTVSHQNLEQGLKQWSFNILKKVSVFFPLKKLSTS